MTAFLSTFLLILLFIEQCIGSYDADEFLKSKIMKIQSKLKEEQYEWKKERHELIQANKELTEQNQELWGENVEKELLTKEKEFENASLRSQMKMWIMGFSGMLTVIVIINIMAYLIFGYRCFRSMCCCKQILVRNNYQPLMNDLQEETVPL